MADSTKIVADPRPQLSAEQIALLARSHGDGEDLSSRRLRALELYLQAPLPDRADNRWRYTRPGSLLPDRLDLQMRPVVPLHLPRLEERAAVVLVQPGAALRSTLSPAAERAGLRVLRLDQDPDLLARLGQAVGAEHGLFEALNLASFNAAALVHVPRGAQIEHPVHLVLPPTQQLTATRLLLVVEAGARVSFVEEHPEGDDAVHASTVTELLVGAGARVQHMLLQRWGGAVVGHQTLRARLERNADYLGLVACLGGKQVKIDAGTRLEGDGARAEIVGFMLGDRRQQLDLHTAQEHRAPHTWSRIDFKVALNDRASAAYTGRIRITPEAPGSEATQENRNLLLSRRARASSIPELEIETDEVSCSHGATVAPVEEEQLTYLCSRGIPRERALQLVLRGFFEATLGRLPRQLREDLEAQLEPRLARVAGGQH